MISRVLSHLDGRALAVCARVCRAWRAAVAAAPRAWMLADYTISVEVWWMPTPVEGDGAADDVAAAAPRAAARPIFATSFSAQRLATAGSDAGGDEAVADRMPCELAEGESALTDLLGDASCADFTEPPHRVARSLTVRVMARRADGAVAALYREPQETQDDIYDTVCDSDARDRLTNCEWWCIDSPLVYVEQPGEQQQARAVAELGSTLWLSFVDASGEPRASGAVAHFSVAGVTERETGMRVTTRELLWALENTVSWVL